VETLDTITRQDLADFTVPYFAPNNTIVSVVGDISRDELIQLLGRYFGDWQQKKIPENVLPAIGQKKSPTVIK